MNADRYLLLAHICRYRLWLLHAVLLVFFLSPRWLNPRRFQLKSEPKSQAEVPRSCVREKYSRAFILMTAMMVQFIYFQWHTGWKGTIQLKPCCLGPLCRQPNQYDPTKSDHKQKLNRWLIWLQVWIKVNLVKVCISLKQLPPVVRPNLQIWGCYGDPPEQEMIHTLHDSILNTFITLLGVWGGGGGVKKIVNNRRMSW